MSIGQRQQGRHRQTDAVPLRLRFSEHVQVVCKGASGVVVKRAGTTFGMISLGLFILAGWGSGPAVAFHEGGAGECEGCHSIHNSFEGAPMTANAPPGSGNRYLLKASDQGSVCLNCHQQAGDTGPTSYHVSTAEVDMPIGAPPRQLTPGGDFGWLKKNYLWMPSLGASMLTSSGDSHGHNIVAQDYGYLQDATKLSAPGGTYPAASMTCISCHDPHGRYRRNVDGSIATDGKPIKGSGSLAGSADPDTTFAVGVYRMLGGIGYNPKSLGGANPFSANPPLAVAPDIYNRSESVSQTRVGYGSGMSEWCRNCHPNIHTDSAPTPLTHPTGSSGTLGSTIAAYYNQYVMTGDLTGMEATSYLSLVPFEVGTTNYPLLKSIVTAFPTKGPSTADGNPAVMCLSCHRAHASGWDGSMRWNNKSSLIVNSGTYAQEGQTFQPYGQGRTEQEALRANYDIPASRFATDQQPLCQKCHATVPP